MGSAHLPECTVVGFTGHRDLAHESTAGAQISAALDELTAKFGPLVAVTSLAKGADVLFVREAIRRKIPLMLILPFPASRFQHDFTPAEWADIAPLLPHALRVDEVSGSASDDEAYMETGVEIVDRADILMAIWDGKPAAGLGGTGDVVAYARALRTPLLWLNPETRESASEWFDHLAAPGDPAASIGDPRARVERHFSELDQVASIRAPRVRYLIQRVVLLHLAASICGAVALALSLHGITAAAVALLEVGLLATAFLWTASRHHSQREWMTTRIEAEICRSFLALWPMRARLGRVPTAAAPGFEPLMRRLRLLQQLDTSPLPPLSEARQAYLDGRIKHQISYFSARATQAQRAYQLLKKAALTATALATVMALSRVVLLSLHIEGPTLTATELFSLVLPLVSAALLALVLTQEHARRASRYREMVTILEEAAKVLAASRTWQGVTRIAIDTEEALLHEAVEWHSFRRFASDPH